MQTWVTGWCQYGAILHNGRIVRPVDLQAHYTCAYCGGGVVVKTVAGEPGRLRAECAECAGRSFISEWALERDIVEWYEIVRKLPDHLREIADLYFQRDPGPPVPYEQAVRELYQE
jgi:hypothetical protein